MTTPLPYGLTLVKDDGEFPVPTELRATIISLVDAFAAGDFLLRDHQIDGVAPVSAKVAKHIAENIEAYGDALASLDEATWRRSIYCWAGCDWDVLVDLTTSREAVSDLTLFLGISDQPHVIEVRSVHVP